jgi:hypothetical protein
MGIRSIVDRHLLAWSAGEEVNSVAGEREQLVALLAALEDPARAAALPPDDATLVAVARHHRLTPLLSATCGATLPATLAEAFRRDRIETAARQMVLGQVAQACIQALAEAGISAAVLKGLDYQARLYDAAGVRPTADVDLLVPDHTRRDAFRVLDRLGFEPRAAAPGFDEPDYHEVAWTRADAEVDLHLALAPLVRCRIDYAAVWAEVRPARLGATDALVLAPAHAAVFHALHMAIDHFGVPAIYLIDLARLLPTTPAREEAGQLARRWRCHRPFATSVALAAALLPRWASGQPASATPWFSRRVVAAYGTLPALPRPEQLWRKVTHFDFPSDALRYLTVQSRRNAREVGERLLRGRSARARLGL